MQLNTIQDINFQQLWKSARKQRAWSSKGPKDWDKKAQSFASRNLDSPYSRLFLEKLPVQPTDTILDVGSGPGTLSLPMAQAAKSVTAVDYSAQMLQTLKDAAAKRDITNVTTVQASWQDNWQEKGITPHDIGIASRSLNVEDLTDAILKLNKFSDKYVFLSDRISPTPFDPKVFEAVGRKFESGPDYIYTLNILYELGIHPHVEILELDKATRYENFDAALNAFHWMLKDVTVEEDKLLQEYIKDVARYHNDGQLTIQRSHSLKWALIWWKNSA